MALLLIVNLANKAWDILAVLFVLRIYPTKCVQGFAGGTRGKEPACQCRRQRDVGLIPGLGRSPEEGHGNPLQYSFLKNSKDGGDWQAIFHRVAKSWTKLSTYAWVYKCVQLCVLKLIEIMLFHVWLTDKFNTVRFVLVTFNFRNYLKFYIWIYKSFMWFDN